MQVSQINQQNYSARSQNKQQAFGIYFKMGKDVESNFLEGLDFLSNSAVDAAKKFEYTGLQSDGENLVSKLYKNIIQHNSNPVNHQLFDDTVDIKRISYAVQNETPGFHVCTDSADSFISRQNLSNGDNVVIRLQSEIENQRFANRHNMLHYLAERAEKTLPPPSGK